MKNILTLLAFALPFGALTQSIYVSNDGNDNNSGSLSDPLENIQTALDFAEPGTTIFVRGGTYYENLYVEVSGEEGGVITLKGFEDEEVFVDGEESNGDPLISIMNKNHIHVKDMQFQNNIGNDAIGILVDGECDGIQIIGCTVSNIKFSEFSEAPVDETTNAQGIIVYGSSANAPVKNLRIVDCTVQFCQTGYSEALAVNGNVEDFTVFNNLVQDITNIGIDIIGHEGVCPDPELDQARSGYIGKNEVKFCVSPYASAAGIYVDGAKSLVIEQNEVYQNQFGIEVGCENVGKSASTISVRSNFIYNNQSAGLVVGGYDYPEGSGSVTSSKILNNTLFNNDTNDDYEGELMISYTENTFITNNIFYARNFNNFLFSFAAESGNGIIMDYNMWYTNAESVDAEVYWNGTTYNGWDEYIAEVNQDQNSIYGNPGIMNDTEASPDLHLDGSSSAIDAGDPTSGGSMGTQDFDGDERFFGSGIDIGGDEQGAPVNVETLVELNEFVVSPNPVQDFIQLSFLNDRSTFEIFSMSGQLIINGVTQNGNIDVQHLPAGMYVLSINDKGLFKRATFAKN